jgi:dTDP-4-amino-4,6-dideoxygalactose transaminase
MAAMLLNIQPGDEVILPSFTFVSTVNAFVLRGAVPIFCEIRPDTLNIDEERIEALITPNTRAIIPVHYAGVGCEMDRILEIANTHNISVIEDNAHGLFGKYKDKFLGTFGRLAVKSFHGTKNITCGEGGALLINDPQLIERAEIIREKGTNRSQFFRGDVDKYTWVDIGSSYLPSDILAAFLLGQLEQSRIIQAKRKHIWDTYHENLKAWAGKNGIKQQFVPAHCDQAYHEYYLIMPSLNHRQEFIEKLKSQGIQAVFHYIPLHFSKMGQRFGGKLGALPITEDLSERLVRLPMYYDLSDEELNFVIDCVKMAFNR